MIKCISQYIAVRINRYHIVRFLWQYRPTGAWPYKAYGALASLSGRTEGFFVVMMWYENV